MSKDAAQLRSDHPCPCGAPLAELVQFGNPVTKSFKGMHAAALSCIRCGYIRFEPPSELKLADYYSRDYLRHTRDWYNIEADYKHEKVEARSSAMIEILKQYLATAPKPVIVEIGCAFGGTVLALRNRGFEAFDVDLNADAIRQGRELGNAYIHSQPAMRLSMQQAPRQI